MGQAGNGAVRMGVPPSMASLSDTTTLLSVKVLTYVHYYCLKVTNVAQMNHRRTRLFVALHTAISPELATGLLLGQAYINCEQWDKCLQAVVLYRTKTC